MTLQRREKGFLRLLIWTLCFIFCFLFISIHYGRTSDEKADEFVHLSSEVNDVSSSYEMIINLSTKYAPSLPLDVWESYKHLSTGNNNNNSNCARYPNIFELEFNNIYWQLLHTSNGTFYVYGAYYDDRILSKLGPSIRILAMAEAIDPKVTTICQLWFRGYKEAVLTEVVNYDYIWHRQWRPINQEKNLHPYLLQCPIPHEHMNKIPDSVSIVEKKCDTSTNNLRVFHDKPEKKKSFAVCVKGLDFLSGSLYIKLIEWIELLNVLGAEKIFFYMFHVHPNTKKVLKYYQAAGKVELVPLTLPGGQPNIPGFQRLYIRRLPMQVKYDEMIPYNDCLYKNLHSYEYIALLDIDEVIMPKKAMSWRELMDSVHSKTYKRSASYNARNVWFLDDLIIEHGWSKDIPQYMHMLQHVYRTKNFTPPSYYIKSFHDPEQVLTVHNHYPINCLIPPCYNQDFDNDEEAQLQHYRAQCSEDLTKSQCDEYRKDSVKDDKILRFKEILIARTADTLKTLGFQDLV